MPGTLSPLTTILGSLRKTVSTTEEIRELVEAHRKDMVDFLVRTPIPSPAFDQFVSAIGLISADVLKEDADLLSQIDLAKEEKLPESLQKFQKMSEQLNREKQPFLWRMFNVVEHKQKEQRQLLEDLQKLRQEIALDVPMMQIAKRKFRQNAKTLQCDLAMLTQLDELLTQFIPQTKGEKHYELETKALYGTKQQTQLLTEHQVVLIQQRQSLELRLAQKQGLLKTLDRIRAVHQSSNQILAENRKTQKMLQAQKVGGNE